MYFKWLQYKSKLDDINVLYDRVFLWLLFGLVSFGFIMVSSGSISAGIRLSNDPFFFIKKEFFYYSVTFILSLFILRIPVAIWQCYSVIILLCSSLMLLLVLMLGCSVNGASRWVMWGFLCVQPSELLKFSFFCYLSDYLVRKYKEVYYTFWGMFKPIVIMLILSILLLAQPDFGSVIILFVTTFFTLFLCGTRLCWLIIVVMLYVFLIILLVIYKSYRIQRMLIFLDPWKDPFGTGYQLTQSLIAFGRGGLFGQGLGNSIQKLEYLPESHTDFVFSIISEELGLVGAIVVLFILFLIVFRAMKIGYCALDINKKFAGVFAFSISIWFSSQIFINVGSAIGILPTKGLTLPFISYGGSSFLIMVISGLLLLRIDFETRLIKRHVFLQNIMK